MRLAHQMAMVNSNIEARSIDANEFMELTRKHNVRGVPKTVINDRIAIEGAVPEPMFLERVMLAFNEA